jgi:hypothetical protein
VGVTTDYALWTHPGWDSRAIQAIAVELVRPSPERLLLTYRVTGRVEDVVLPPPAPPLRRDRLWESTCFELFLQPPGASGYVEFNFAPSGEWAAYSFEGYRAGMAQAAVPAAPAISCSRTTDGIAMEVSLSLWPASVRARLGLAVIVDETSGPKSYWAISHCGDEPDFHRADCFVGELPPPPGA